MVSIMAYFVNTRMPISGDSAGNVTRTLVPPTGKMHRIVSVHIQAINDSTVANRYPVVRIRNAKNDVRMIVESPAVFAASTSFRATFGALMGYGAGANSILIPMPEMYVNYDEKLEILMVGGVAGDVYVARVFAEEMTSPQGW